MNPPKIFATAKLGSTEFMNKFRNEGHIYCNTLGYFRKLKNDSIRGDISEGLSASYSIDKIKIQINGKTIGGLTSVKLNDPSEEEIAIFSMYALTDKNIQAPFEERVKAFGETVVIITDSDEFVNRIIQKCKQLNWHLQFKLVEYIDEKTHEGRMGSFRKYNKLNHQSEFRFAIKTGQKEQSRISTLATYATLRQYMKLQKYMSLFKLNMIINRHARLVLPHRSEINPVRRPGKHGRPLA